MRMEAEPGKLFIGGISWDTDEVRLKEYFQNFGEVVEAVIMKDRTTGRARGFGFVVFADPAAAETVVKEKHIIDGRTVEAKKAVPRDDQHIVNRNSSSTHSSPGPVRTKKIFVGGLASNVTESDFKTYFDQFGLITDVVVMYDHNTQRPRGFGFITYDTEDAVEKVLLKTFHELNGKMVEVKRAVPKELSPGPSRSPLGGGYNYGLNRVSNFLNAYTQGYNPNSMGGYGLRMDGRFSPVTVGRSGYPPFSPSSYNMGPMLDSALGSNYGASGNFGSSLGFGRGLNPFYGNSNRFSPQMGYGIGGGGTGTGTGIGTGSSLNSPGRSPWGNGNFNYNTNSSNTYDFVGSGSANTGSLGAFGGTGGIWGSSSISGQGGGNVSSSSGGNMSYNGGGENSIVSARGHGRNSGSSNMGITLNDVHDGALGNFYTGGGSSFYGDSTWRSLSPEIEGSGSFSYGLGSAVSDVTPNNSMGFDGGHNITSRTNRGIPGYEDHYTITTKLL